MNSIEVALAMLLAVVGSGYLVRMLPFSLPLPLFLDGWRIPTGTGRCAISPRRLDHRGPDRG